MIEFRCKQCKAKMTVPESISGQTEMCPECNATNKIPIISPKTNILRVVWIIVVILAVIVSYFTAMRFGPERWRINEQGKTAYVALDELHTSIQTPIGKSEYGQCVRHALLKVKPYMESQNAKSCPKFSDWLGKTMACYASAAEAWNEPVSDYATTELGEKLKYAKRDLIVQIKWDIASHCLTNTKCIMDGDNIRPLEQNEVDEMMK